MKEKFLVGAHMSAAQGVENALLRGEKIGATAIQLFTSNQRQWRSKPLTQTTIEKWQQAQETTGITTTISHDSYLINLGSVKEDILNKSLASFSEEITRCKQLNITYLNFHPGVATASDEQKCLEQIVTSLLSFQKSLENSPTRLLLETTAGQGNSVGHKFEHIAYIIQQVEKKIPIGVCIDTCHIFCAGYDLRDKKAVEKTVKEFDEIIGLDHLYALHLNDSKKPFNTRRDRHASLGKGEIGIDGIEAIVRHAKLYKLPFILETPDPSLYEEEIQLVKNYAKQPY